MQWAKDKLAALRSRHKIVTDKDWDDDLHGYTLRCRQDGVRVHPNRNGTYRHDIAEMRQLALAAEGILPKIDWSPRPIEPRVIAAPNIEERQRVEMRQAIAAARRTIAETQEIRRLVDADVEAANRWTEEEILMVAHQSDLL